MIMAYLEYFVFFFFTYIHFCTYATLKLLRGLSFLWLAGLDGFCVYNPGYVGLRGEQDIGDYSERSWA